MESARALPLGVNMKLPFDSRSNWRPMSSSVSSAKAFTSEAEIPSRVRNPSAIRSVRFISSVRFSIGPRLIVRKEPDQYKRDNRRHFANAASQWSKPRSVRFPDNLSRASRRGYELIRNQDARNSRFRNVGSRHLPDVAIVISNNSASASESCRNSPLAWRRKNSVSSSYVRQ